MKEKRVHLQAHLLECAVRLPQKGGGCNEGICGHTSLGSLTDLLSEIYGPLEERAFNTKLSSS